MTLEIERKFLIDNSKIPGCLKPRRIAQGYLVSLPERTVRVRIAGDEAFLTIKGRSSDDGLSRYEYEQQIDVDEAYHLLSLCEPGVIYKNRYVMIYRGKTWEIDEFRGANLGLWIAEVELECANETIELPSWVIEEVTGDIRFYNSHLSKNPFTTW